MATERPRLEVADVVRVHGQDYRSAHTPSVAQEHVLKNIVRCRTAVLGGHVDACKKGCGFSRISYNSCRDRHCPKCQSRQQTEWVTKRLERILPVPYFHVVFTIPDALNPLALRNKKVIYSILFKAASQTLIQLGRDPKRLNVDLGVTAVLHTWGQNLLFHPHLHCIVTGGGLSLNGKRWVLGRERYLLPIKVLGKLFRGKFMALLERAYKEGEFDFKGSTADLADPMIWARLSDGLYNKNWVVYAKPPFGGPTQVFRYLGRYTHRVAISNSRIQSIANGRVRFSMKNYKDGAKNKTMSLAGAEFLRRFLLHVLPKGFVRIRHYGLCASRNVNTKLLTAKRLLEPELTVNSDDSQEVQDDTQPWWERFREMTGVDVMACPCCGGRLERRPAMTADLVAAKAEARAPPRLS
jgi:Putative transposase/Transposase zinc-binding domain